MQWTIDWPEESLAARDAATADQVSRAENLAAASLRSLTLNRVGGLPRTVMPAGRTCTSPVMKRDMFYPAPYFPSSAALKACNCALYCGCAGVNGVWLEAPVGEILEVKVDGVVLDADSYHVEDGNRLIRHGIGATWPACGGKDFTVTYLNAYPVDAMGAYAGGVLAWEFLKSITSAKNCRLSARATAVSRQGINMELTPGMFPDGTTGLEEVDVYLRLWNPAGIKHAPKVYSIDAPVQREVTWGVF